MKADIIAICGYTRHGKDTTYQSLVNLARGDKPKYPISFGSDTYSDIVSLLKSKVIRFGSADVIKQEMCEKYNLTLEKLEELKDQINPQTNKPYRSEMKSIARYHLSIDRQYFIKKIRSLESHIHDSTIVITDFRTVYEQFFLESWCQENGYKLITVRVHRQDVPIPPENDMTEHQLDNLITDFIATSTKNVDILSKSKYTCNYD